MGEARILLRDAAASAAVPTEVERKLSVLELLWNDGFVRKAVIIIFLAVVWEAYGRFLDNPLLFPTLVTRIAMMPAARTRAPTTSNQRLKRRDERAFWTTLAFTAIRIVDAGNRVRLEDRRLGPGAPRVS